MFLCYISEDVVSVPGNETVAVAATRRSGLSTAHAVLVSVTCVLVIAIAAVVIVRLRILVLRRSLGNPDVESAELQGLQALPLPRPRGEPPMFVNNPNAWL